MYSENLDHNRIRCVINKCHHPYDLLTSWHETFQVIIVTTNLCMVTPNLLETRGEKTRVYV